MKFKKDGEMFDSIAPAVDEHCQKQQYCFQCVLYRKRGTKCCEDYAYTNPEEVAHLLDFEVIEDEPTIGEMVENSLKNLNRRSKEKIEKEVVEKHSEDAKPDPVNRPAHYTSGGIDCIDAMQAAFGDEAVKDFCLCNAFKYLWRHRNKNGVEDLKKARWYLNRLIEEVEE